MRALVTGAGRRLGRAMALELAQRGHDVAVHHRASRDEARAVVAEIEATGRRAVALCADLDDDEAARALLPRAADALGGPVTCLVNNASHFRRDLIATVTPETWDAHMGSNLRAPVWLIQAMAAQGLRAGEGDDGAPLAAGLVVNMVDASVLRPGQDFLSYTIAKAGLWALTQAMARGLAPDIRVNAIGPGPTMKAPHQSRAHFDAMQAALPLRRGADASDVRVALGYLLGARAVTGELICLDGGGHLAR